MSAPTEPAVDPATCDFDKHQTTAPAAAAPKGEHHHSLQDSLRIALSQSPHVPFDALVRADCFILGARCAKIGVRLPVWLDRAPLWGQTATSNGSRALAAR